RSRGLGDVYKRQACAGARKACMFATALAALAVFSLAPGLCSGGQAGDPLEAPSREGRDDVAAIVRELIKEFEPKEEDKGGIKGPGGPETEKKKRPFFGMEGYDFGTAGHRDPKDAVRKLAAYRSAAIPALKDALRDKRPQVRFYAAQTLSLIKGKDAARALLPVLRDAGELPVTRVFAARAVGDEDLDEAIPDLIAAAKDPDRRLRLVALESLSVMSRGWNAGCEAACVEALGDGAAEVRAVAASTLGERKCRAAVPRLCAVLTGDDSDDVRATAALALLRIGSPAAVPHLVRALDEKYPKAARNSAAALRAIVGSLASDPAGWRKWWEEIGKNREWKDEAATGPVPPAPPPDPEPEGQ
ncbi:MAG: HEAT repeat domain-containing protein, partial [Planctomycetota bacterium]|nr:HEAT repeat domain-containing protein [Planctomycetota bacterium]